MASSFQHVGSFSVVCGLLSSCGAWAPEHGLCSLRHVAFVAPTACGILVPQPGIEPVSPAMAGGFLTTVPPGKPRQFAF